VYSTTAHFYGKTFFVQYPESSGLRGFGNQQVESIGAQVNDRVYDR
jgi:hypothetical protein